MRCRAYRGHNGKPASPFLLSRRQAVTVLLAGIVTGTGGRWLRADTIVPTSQALADAKPKSVRLFTARGAGDEDGRDWQNAMPVGALGKALSFARPGSGFLIGFAPDDEPVALDKGQLVVKISGDGHDPVFIQAGAVSGSHELGTSQGTFFMNTRPWSLDRFGKGRGAGSYIAFANGASHLRLSGFRVDGTSADGFFKFRAKKSRPADFEDIVLSGIDARNVGRVIETERGAALRNILVADCRAHGIVRGFARFRDLSHSTLRDLDLDAAGMDAGGSNVCQLISWVSGEEVTFENITLRNAINQPAPSQDGKQRGYVQGDGIVGERQSRNVTIRNCHASGMGDGGFDLKTTDVTIEDSSADSCKFGARIWSNGNNVVRRCSFRNPQTRGDTKGACIQVSGSLQIVDTKLQAGPGTSAISVHKNRATDPVVRMQGGSIQLDGDAQVATASSSGVLELHDVMVNGVATTHRYVFEKKE